MSTSLRPYQLRALDEAAEAYHRGSRAILLVAPTGAGKTRIGVEFCRRKQTLWLAHRTELVEQSVAHLRREGVEDVGVITARESNPNRVTVASIQTLLARESTPTAEVVVFDEAHHFVADKWKQIADAYIGAIRIGLTATPERADGSALGDIFTELVKVSSVPELTDAGHLVPLEIYAGSCVDGAIAQHPREVFNRGRATIVFAANVAHAESLQQDLGGAVVLGTTAAEDRARIVAEFKAGRVNPLINLYCLTEGFDAPNAEVCILARGCDSLPLYLQIVGRILRPAPGKHSARLYDLSGAVHKHGLPTGDREYSLTGKPISKTLGEVWQCKACGAVLEAYPGPTCSECGATAQPGPPRTPKITREELRLIRETHDNERRIEALRKLAATAKIKGYKPGWAAYRFKSRYGRWPTREEQQSVRV